MHTRRGSIQQMSMANSMMIESPAIGKKRYMPGLDGLRALSVIAVIAYHLDLPWASGGFLGVGIFLTLSGYLITDQLMMQWHSTSTINLKDFWLRRLRRLAPAVFFMLGIVYLWLVLFDRPRLGTFQNELLSVIFYFNNWWLIFHKVSYFDSFGLLSPIRHLWSLAVEEQFYLFWPIILIILLHFMQKRRSLIYVILIGAVASILAMALIYQPGSDPSRVYYGTDTRAFALLIGAAFAVAFPSMKLPKHIPAKSRRILDLIGGTGLLGIIMIILRTNEYDTYLYTGGLALFSIISALVTVILAHPASRVAEFLSCKPLRWIGVRSYSLYLWHYPVIILMNPVVDTGGLNIVRIALQIVVTFLLSAFSWKFIEEPVRHGSLTRWLRNLYPEKNKGAKRILFKRRFLPILAMTLLFFFIISCTSNLDKENASQVSSSTASGEIHEDDHSAQSKQSPLPAADSRGAASDITKKDDSKGTAPDIVEKSPAEQNPTMDPTGQEDKSGKEIVVIGDSIILDAAPYLDKLLPGILIDGKVGRQMAQAQEVVNQLKGNGKLTDRVLIELGTNGPFTEKQLRELLTSLGEMKQIILVNVRVPKRWQDTVNSRLKTVTEEFSNTTLVDWFSASKGKDSFFSNDGVHLSQEGASYYATLISEAVKNEDQ